MQQSVEGSRRGAGRAASGNPFAQRVSSNGIVVTDGQLQFFARKRGLEAVAAWAAECMGLTGHPAARYQQEIAAAFRETTVDTRLLCQIQTDLERAGKPALSTYAATVFANAVEEARADLDGLTAGKAIAPPPSRSRGGLDQRAP